MQITSEDYSIDQRKDTYFHRFTTKNGEEIGLRFGVPQDAKGISIIFKEVYGYEYAYPIVYDINHLKRELSNKNKFWIVGELTNDNEIAGVGLIEKKRYIAHASQAVAKKKYHGLGILAKLGAVGIIYVIKLPQFKDTLRLDGEPRALKIGAQTLIRKAGGIPYGLIPAYINYGDKRKFMIDDITPVPPLKEEAAFLYSIVFKNLWRKRENKVYLLNNEDFIFFYNYVKKMSKKMNNDDLILEAGKNDKDYELYGVSKDFYEGRVNLYGYIKEKSLNNLLRTYQNWRILIWRIPTTQNGIHSMSLALKNGFNIVGYDIGINNVNWTLFDSVILAYYPNGGSQILKAFCRDENKPLLNKIKEIFVSRVN
ncbi:MAG: hypothetical protein ACFFAN_13200 [Promethearchaeota archaeon]